MNFFCYRGKIHHKKDDDDDLSLETERQLREKPSYLFKLSGTVVAVCNKKLAAVDFHHLL